jgi:hypothetical protein
VSAAAPGGVVDLATFSLVIPIHIAEISIPIPTISFARLTPPKPAIGPSKLLIVIPQPDKSLGSSG